MIIIALFTPCAMADDNRIITEINAKYSVIPDEETVHVVKEIIFYNNDPNTRYWRGFYSNYNHYLPKDAKNIRSYDDERKVVFRQDEEGYHTFMFNKKVWYEENYRFYVAYDIEVNKNTATFYLNEYGRNTAVTLEVPSDFDTYIEREDYTLETKRYSNVYSFEKGQKWTGSCFVNSVRLTEQLTLREVACLEERDVEIEVNYWEGEEEWAQKMLDTTLESLPILEETWNVPFPANYNISITQASIDETQGYGGFNNGRKGIWMLHSSSEEILIHELAHYWTRACNFDQIWMDEGYADLYTYIVLKEIDPDKADARKERFIHKYENMKNDWDIPLSKWSTPESIDSISEEIVDFGYKKAFALTYEIYETIGIEEMKLSNLEFVRSSSSVDNEIFMHVISDSTSENMLFIDNYIY
ncbi:hypothetical protein V7O66_02385 [Methanolobus sp. ZRKC3]|uniref:hypothetical protein n=1 Tax=Methanolobus sp. ZRKC3 TaxID=3125786 RepID=UPI0032462CFE